MLKKFFLPLLLVELFFTTLFIWRVGFGSFFLESLVTFVIGSLIISRNKRLTNSLLITFFVGNFSTVLAAFLLMIPGVFTDICGAIMLLWTLFSQPREFKRESEFDKFNDSRAKFDNDDIIDVEIIEEDKNAKDNNSN